MAEQRYVIFNGDDFGASPGINRGIVQAHVRGVLTSTSLMVNMPAAVEAVAMARDLPKLSLGIHVNFTNEGDPPVVDIDDVTACRDELEWQLERFDELVGRPPTHIDSQHNVHFRQTLTPLFRESAKKLGVPLRGFSAARYFPSFYGQWDGETHLEQISEASLRRMMVGFTDRITEVGCHPGYRDPDFASVYSVEREAEIETLCAEGLPGFLASQGFSLIGFAELGEVL
jgi:predicted glycoside hydrolase/deacetylase ChbG (UPF0249 family)